MIPRGVTCEPQQRGASGVRDACARQGEERRSGGHEPGVRWFVGIYLVIGFLLALGVYGWAMVWSIRRHGFRDTVRGAVKTYIHELPLYWRVPWAAWTVLIAAPLIAAWAIVTGDWGSPRCDLPCSALAALPRATPMALAIQTAPSTPTSRDPQDRVTFPNTGASEAKALRR
jgi:hypothetical protein